MDFHQVVKRKQIHVEGRFRSFRGVTRSAFLVVAIVGLGLEQSQGRALSAEIQMMPYQYASDMGVIAPSDQTFVLCDCKPAAPLFVKPKEVPISVRANEPFHFSLPPALHEEAIQKDDKIVKVGNDLPQMLHPTGSVRPASDVTPTIVRFGFNQVSLTASQESEVLKVAEEVKKSGGGVKILGHTCDLGTSDRNIQISRDRAEQVAAIFKGQGVDVADIEGKGSCCPLSTDRRLNRRVEIVVLKKGGEHEK